MCGIVGIAGDLFFKEEKTMQSLLLLDYFRGMDSTGLAAVRTHSNEVHIAKLATDPITLFQFPKFKEALNGNASKLFLGHNRASTSGKTSNYNAHPFEVDHIVGVQNGTLEYSDKSALETALDSKFDVDSEALFAAIAKFGVKDTFKMIHEGSDSIRGAWALAWYDKKEDTINFLRNKHRPLWFAWDKDFKRLFFASRYEFISHATTMSEFAYDLERYEHKDKPGEFYRYFHLPENQHWKFNLDELRKGNKERPKPIMQVIKGKEPKTTSSGGYKPPHWDPFYADKDKKQGTMGFATTTTKKSNSSTTACRGNETDRQGNGVFHIFTELSSEPYSYVIDERRFRELVQDYGKGQSGCSFCAKEIKFGDAGITVYDEQDTILCAECSGNIGDDTAAKLKVYVSPQHYAELRKAA